jgi:hypothetical protein
MDTLSRLRADRLSLGGILLRPVWQISGSLCDALICGFMLWSLRQAHVKTSEQGLARVIKRLVTITISTNLLTTITNVVGMISFLVGTGGDVVTDRAPFQTAGACG